MAGKVKLPGEQRHIYPVFILTGEFEDARDDILHCFSTKEDADKFAARIRAALKKSGLDKRGYGDRQFVYQKTPYTVDYTGASVAVGGPFPLD